MNRRDLTKWLVAIGFAPSLLSAWAQADGVRKRRSLADPAAVSDIEAFALAAKSMMLEKDDTSPASWNYWANVHGVTVAVPENLRRIWGTCDHGIHFLSWHRMYLAFFEAAIAKASGKADFAMPYWNWYQNIEIPVQFTTPADSANALWRAGRGYDVNYRVGTGVLTKSSFMRFTQTSFGNPHSNIHLNFAGEMSDANTAARDPIFWPHHVSMDRLWEQWRGISGNMNPSADSDWGNQRFNFLVADAGSATVRSMLEISQLGYEYDNLATNPPETRLPGRPVPIEIGVVKPFLESNATNPSGVDLSERRSVNLDGKSKTVRLPLPAAASSTLESVGSPRATASTLTLMLEGVELTPAGRSARVLYDIYVNLPRTSPAETREHAATSHYVGQINSFGLGAEGAHGGHAGHQGEKVRLEFALDEMVPTLKTLGAWSADQIEVNFVEPSTRSVNAGPLVRIESVKIRVSTGR